MNALFDFDYGLHWRLAKRLEFAVLRREFRCGKSFANDEQFRSVGVLERIEKCDGKRKCAPERGGWGMRAYSFVPLFTIKLIVLSSPFMMG